MTNWLLPILHAPQAEVAGQRLTKNSMPPNQVNKKTNGERRANGAFIALAILTIVTFALGGSARSDEAQVVFLRPITMCFLLAGVIYLRPIDIRRHRFLILWMLAVVALTVAHLIPLPPDLWGAMSGRKLISELDHTLGWGQRWRPVSISPELTRNALWSLALPFSTVLLTIQLSDHQVYKILNLLVLLGLTSAALSIIQLTGGQDGGFYLYRITNYGAGVGVFANRNHNAVFLACLLPIIYAILLEWKKNARSRTTAIEMALPPLMLTMASVLILLLSLVTGSRAGFVFSCVSVVGVWLHCVNLVTNQTPAAISFSAISGTPGEAFRGKKFLIIIVGLIITTLAIANGLGQYEAFRRILATKSESEGRADIFWSLIELIKLYAPFGSGIGTFDPAYRMIERTDLLSPTYWNHAHSDWLELAITAGIPGLILISVGAVWLCIRIHRMVKLHKEEYVTGQIVVVASIVATIILSSGADYPLRTPILMSMFAFAVGMLSRLTHQVRYH